MITSFLIPSLIKWVAGATLVSKHIDDKFLNENKDKASENLTSQSKQSNKSYLFRNVKTGFELIIKGVNEQNTDSLINIKEGIYCLKNIYSEEQELMSNIISYYRFTEKPDIQLFIQKLFRIEKYIKFLILENSYEEFVKNSF